MRYKLTGGDLAKDARLNPYKRITKGTEVTVKVDGEEVVAIVDMAGKYTYLNVGGVDYYVTVVLTEGTEYETCTWEPAQKKVKAAAVEGEPSAEGEEAAPKAKKSRKPKAEEAVEA